MTGISSLYGQNRSVTITNSSELFTTLLYNYVSWSFNTTCHQFGSLKYINVILWQNVGKSLRLKLIAEIHVPNLGGSDRWLALVAWDCKQSRPMAIRQDVQVLIGLWLSPGG